jgi:uncharacterized membrane protein YphA (DoxX/SURF4 family)
MDILIWVLQVMLVFVFLFSGITKSTYSKEELLAKPQIGIDGLPIVLIRFIGIAEVIGAMGLIIPMLLGIYSRIPFFSALGLGLIMVPAAIIHFIRKEYKNIILNAIIFLVCMLIAYFRM